MNNHRTNASSYMAMTNNGGSIQRIRTPTKNDILLGRGGSVNGHVGNQVFREWVRARKDDYNLAPNKVEKAQVATEVMEMVHQHGGRFLQRDPTTSTNWWVEVDETRALAKTSQALREGAPQIRAAHKGSKKPVVKRKRRARNVATTSSPAPRKRIRSETPTVEWPETVPEAAVVPPGAVSPDPYATALDELNRNMLQAKSSAIMSHEANNNDSATEEHRNPQDDLHDPHNDHLHHGHEQAVYLEETPNLLTSIPQMPHELPPSHIKQPSHEEDNDASVAPPPIPSKQPMQRFNSLALSDISGAWTNSGDWGSSISLSNNNTSSDFVNPFLDESDAVHLAEKNKDRLIRLPTTEDPSLPPPPSSPHVRNVSSDIPNTEYDQLGKMYGLDSTLSNHVDGDDFNDELKQIFFDNSGGKEMPTLLMPYRGGLSKLQRRYGSQSSRLNSKGTTGSSNNSGRRSVSPHQ